MICVAIGASDALCVSFGRCFGKEPTARAARSNVAASAIRCLRRRCNFVLDTDTGTGTGTRAQAQVDWHTERVAKWQSSLGCTPSNARRFYWPSMRTYLHVDGMTGSPSRQEGVPVLIFYTRSNVEYGT